MRLPVCCQTMNMTNPAIIHMQLLSTQMNEQYRQMKDERKVLSRWEEEQEFSILGMLELFSGDIQGYVETIALTPQTIPETEVLTHLRKLNTFQVDDFTAWYFENWQTYPQIKQYIEQLDHLRLLLIEHFDARVPVAA
jgi:hypothetical protein